jgi:hypothetical protein
MQYPSLRTTALLVLAAFGLIGASQAQNVQHAVKVDIPFDFTAKDLSFPGGTYYLVGSSGRLVLRDSQNHFLTWLLPLSAVSAGTAPATKVQFSTEGGGHALYRIWLEGENFGYELTVPKSAQSVKSGSPSTAQISRGNQP